VDGGVVELPGADARLELVLAVSVVLDVGDGSDPGAPGGKVETSAPGE
jgi:hypothetical protein